MVPARSVFFTESSDAECGLSRLLATTTESLILLFPQSQWALRRFSFHAAILFGRLLLRENYGVLETAWNEIEREMVYADEARSRAAWFLGPLSPRRPFFKPDKHQQALINFLDLGIFF